MRSAFAPNLRLVGHPVTLADNIPVESRFPRLCFVRWLVLSSSCGAIPRRRRRFKLGLLVGFEKLLESGGSRLSDEVLSTALKEFDAARVSRV